MQKDSNGQDCPAHFHIFKSIRSTMLFLFSSLVITALFIFFLISLNYTENTVVENSTDYTMQLISQVNKDIDSYIEYMQNLSLMFSSNSDIQNFLRADYSGTSIGSVPFRSITKQFGTIMDARSDIYNIGVLTADHRYVLNYGNDSLNQNIDPSKLNWYQDTLRANGKSTLSSSHVQTLVQDDYKWVITLSNALLDPQTQEISGILFIDLNYSAINDLCENVSLGSKGYVFILDEKGELIYHPQQQLLYSGLKTERVDDIMAFGGKKGHFITDEGNNSKLYTASTSSNTGWTAVGVAYTSELMANKQKTQEIYLIVAVLLLLLTLIICTLISTSITKPIRALQASMLEVEKGNFETAAIPITDETEIGSLSKSFNIMIRKIQKLMEENIEEQRQKRSSELRALQAQINPHFLYNTLDSIIWMAEGGNSSEVVLMTSSLSKLLRQSISNQDELVSIRDEISYTKTYLTIQKMRYQDKLEFFIDVDEEILAEPIIKLILQPLVENAIYHGIKYKKGIGILYISGSREKDCAALYVEDNGVGMDAEALSHIFEQRPAEKSGSGVGINNIQNRLLLYYGPGYGLSYDSTPGKGTTVKVRIPGSWKEVSHEAE